MATIIAHIRVHPKGAERFEELARHLYRETHAVEDRVTRYEYWRGEEPFSYYTLLSFPDYLGFIAHQASPHHVGASPALRELIDVIRLEWVDPLGGAAPLEPTNPAELPADASELEIDYSDRFPPKVAEWWSALRELGQGR